MRAFYIVILSFIFPLACLATDFKKACLKNICIEAEIADSAGERQQGLMFRGHLAENQGMLFILDEEIVPSFWMRNMQFPLDVLWIDKEKKIVGITENARPCVNNCVNLTIDKKVKFVLELNSGFVKKNQIEVGESITF